MKTKIKLIISEITNVWHPYENKRMTWEIIGLIFIIYQMI